MRVNFGIGINNEDGAVMVVVVLLLTAMLGMTVLVVDVGGLLGLRRRMVAAADSAALAAAQSCATEESGVSFQADVIAQANVPDTTRVGLTARGCGTSGEGEVTVSYTTPKELYFAPVLGTPRNADVGGRATGMWAPAAGATPAPVVLNTSSSGTSQCLLMRRGQVCGFWHDGGISDLTAIDHFGFVNLDRWGVSRLSSCRNADRQLAGWINGQVKVDVELAPSGATYVCATSGRSRVSTTLAALRSRIGDTVQMPVSDVSGISVFPGRSKFRAVGYVPLEIVNALRGDDPRAAGTPGASGTCTANLNLRRGDTVWLDALNRPGCPDGRTPETISNLELTPRRGRPYVVGRDYSYNSLTHVVTWLRSGRRTRVGIRFDWDIPGTSGACGNRSPNSSHLCLLVRFNRPHIGGRLGATARDFGLRAIGLQE
jgi:Flp pilus assembly protein TadG